MTKLVRYELRVDEEFIDRITKVADDADISRVDAIILGIDLLERLVEADKQGKEFMLVNKKEKTNDQN